MLIHADTTTRNISYGNWLVPAYVAFQEIEFESENESHPTINTIKTVESNPHSVINMTHFQTNMT